MRRANVPDIAVTSTIDPAPLLNVGVDPVLAMVRSKDLNMALNSSPLELLTQSPHEADLAFKSPVTKMGMPGGIDLMR